MLRDDHVSRVHVRHLGTPGSYLYQVLRSLRDRYVFSIRHGDQVAEGRLARVSAQTDQDSLRQVEYPASLWGAPPTHTGAIAIHAAIKHERSMAQRQRRLAECEVSRC